MTRLWSHLIFSLFLGGTAHAALSKVGDEPQFTGRHRLAVHYGADPVAEATAIYTQQWMQRGYDAIDQDLILQTALWYIHNCHATGPQGHLWPRSLQESLRFADTLTYYAGTDGLSQWLAQTVGTLVPHITTDLQAWYMQNLFSPLYQKHEGQKDALDFVVKWTHQFSQGAHPLYDHDCISNLLNYLSTYVLENPHDLHAHEGQLETVFGQFQAHTEIYPYPFPHTQALGFLAGALGKAQAKKVAFPGADPKPILFKRQSSGTSIASGDTLPVDETD